MEELRLGAVEARFADIIWSRAPLSTKELVALCEKELNWKRTTTYTVLKKLCATTAVTFVLPDEDEPDELEPDDVPIVVVFITVVTDVISSLSPSYIL